MMDSVIGIIVLLFIMFTVTLVCFFSANKNNDLERQKERQKERREKYQEKYERVVGNPLEYFDYTKIINILLPCFYTAYYDEYKDSIFYHIDRKRIGKQLLDENLPTTILKLCVIEPRLSSESDESNGYIISNDRRWTLAVTKAAMSQWQSSYEDALRLKAEAHEANFRANFAFLSHK